MGRRLVVDRQRLDPGELLVVHFEVTSSPVASGKQSVAYSCLLHAFFATLRGIPKKQKKRCMGSPGAAIHAHEQRDRQEKRSHCESASLVLASFHIADAPPTGSRSRYVVTSTLFFVLVYRRSSRTRGPYKNSLHSWYQAYSPDCLVLPHSPPQPQPTRISFPNGSKTPPPFIASTFSQACPTRAPGDQSKMYSVLGTLPRSRQ